MVGLVETMLKLHRDLLKAKTPYEQESLQRKIAARDEQTDQPVCRLYELTRGEVGFVEKNGDS
jgi:hypothetical protein